MASVGIAPASGLREPSGNVGAIDKLPEEMSDMKIRDDKVGGLFYSLAFFILCCLCGI